MEASSQKASPLRKRPRPLPPLPRSVSLNAIETHRHSSYLTSFYNNLDTINESDRFLRRASLREGLQNWRETSNSEILADVVIGEEDMENNQQHNPNDYHTIPPVPRIPSIYRSRYGPGASRGQLPRPSGQSSIRPPVTIDRQRNGDMLPTPDPLRGASTVARSGLTASATFHDLSQSRRYASDNRPLPHVSSYSSNINHRDSMHISLSKPHHEIPPMMVPVTKLGPDEVQSGLGSSSAGSSTYCAKKSDELKNRSPKPSRSIFNLRKASAPEISTIQASTMPKSPRSKVSSPQLRKTSSLATNIAQVSQGAAPVTRDASLTIGSNEVELSAKATVDRPLAAKRQRSLFSLRKTPTQAGNVDVGHSASARPSIASRDVKSSVAEMENSESRRQLSCGTESSKSSKTTPKVSQSIFGLRKTPIGMPSVPVTPSTVRQGQSNNRLVASPRQYVSNMNLKQKSPTRIPTPVAENKIFSFSRPMMLSQKKENIPPQTHSLLRPISPTRTQGSAPKTIPKAQTLGMLSNLTSAFSRSTTNIASASNSSTMSLGKTAQPTTFISQASATAEQQYFTPSIQHITTAMPSGYWAGRFMSLSDRFQCEMMDETFSNPEIFKNLQDPTHCSSRAPSSDPKKAQDQAMYEPATTGIQHIRSEEDRRVLKVFAYLRDLCVGAEAQKSLFEFQQEYARNAGNEKWLPFGGSMEDKPHGWVARMSNVMGRRNEKTGNRTSMGRRTGMTDSVFGNKRSQTTSKTLGH